MHGRAKCSVRKGAAGAAGAARPRCIAAGLTPRFRMPTRRNGNIPDPPAPEGRRRQRKTGDGVMASDRSGVLFALVSGVAGEARAEALFRMMSIHPALAADAGPKVSRAVMAQGLNMLLFEDLLARVPAAADYARDRVAKGERL